MDVSIDEFANIAEVRSWWTMLKHLSVHEDEGKVDLNQVRELVHLAPLIKGPIAMYGNRSKSKDDSAGQAASQGSKKVVTCSLCKIFRPDKAAGHIKSNVNCPSRNDEAVLSGHTPGCCDANGEVPRACARAPIGFSASRRKRKGTAAEKYLKWQCPTLETQQIKDICVAVFKERLKHHEQFNTVTARAKAKNYRTLVQLFEETEAANLNCSNYHAMIRIGGIGPEIAKKLIDGLEARAQKKQRNA